MTCRDPRRWQARIALEVGGDLPPEEREALTAHLEACPACRDLARELTDDRRTLAALADQEPPEEALDRVRSRVLAAVREDRRGPARAPEGGWRSLRIVLPALAAALFAVAVGLALWLPGAPERPDGGGGPVVDVETPGPRDVDVPPAPRGADPGQPPAPSQDGARPSAGDAPTGRRAGPEPAPAPNEHLAAGRTAPALSDWSAPAAALDEIPTATDSDIKIQIVSDDPDIVFYWLTDEPKEEPDDEPV